MFPRRKSRSVDFLRSVPDEAPFRFPEELGGRMEFILHPWLILILALSLWINHEQVKAIEYLMTENQIVREHLGKGRILLKDVDLPRAPTYSNRALDLPSRI